MPKRLSLASLCWFRPRALPGAGETGGKRKPGQARDSREPSQSHGLLANACGPRQAKESTSPLGPSAPPPSRAVGLPAPQEAHARAHTHAGVRPAAPSRLGRRAGCGPTAPQQHLASARGLLPGKAALGAEEGAWQARALAHRLGAVAESLALTRADPSPVATVYQGLRSCDRHSERGQFPPGTAVPSESQTYRSSGSLRAGGPVGGRAGTTLLSAPEARTASQGSSPSPRGGRWPACLPGFSPHG